MGKGCVKLGKYKSGFAVGLVDIGEWLIRQECIDLINASSAVLDVERRYSSEQKKIVLKRGEG